MESSAECYILRNRLYGVLQSEWPKDALVLTRAAAFSIARLSSSVTGMGFVCGEGFYRAVGLAGWDSPSWWTWMPKVDPIVKTIFGLR